MIWRWYLCLETCKLLPLTTSRHRSITIRPSGLCLQRLQVVILFISRIFFKFHDWFDFTSFFCSITNFGPIINSSSKYHGPFDKIPWKSFGIFFRTGSLFQWSDHNLQRDPSNRPWEQSSNRFGLTWTSFALRLDFGGDWALQVISRRNNKSPYFFKSSIETC